MMTEGEGEEKKETKWGVGRSGPCKGGETHTHTHTHKLPLKASRLQLPSYNLQLTFLLNTGVRVCGCVCV